ncbi:MAG: D-hexose-6-phosphate mutarotase [Oceanospirillaceae bacterium]|nr:D-hexose-6-phosphate mutarotase [Oceanospirillaceae bacterium]
MFEPFTLADRVQFFSGPGQLPQCALRSPKGRATISLQGAQVLSFCPAGGEDLLWLSPDARFRSGAPIRGGIPICWPWFGPHPEQADFPAHGFARTTLWEVRSSFADDDASSLTLGLTDSPSSRSYWPANFDLELRVTLTDRLQLQLTTRNSGSQAFQYTEALHSYLAIADVAQVSIEGLHPCRYFDKLEHYALKSSTELLTPHPPLDRVYDHRDSAIALVDRVMERTLALIKSGSESTIVWNPGTQLLPSDIPLEQSSRFICIEAGNALERSVRLMPDEQHTLSLTLSQLNETE